MLWHCDKFTLQQVFEWRIIDQYRDMVVASAFEAESGYEYLDESGNVTFKFRSNADLMYFYLKLQRNATPGIIITIKQ